MKNKTNEMDELIKKALGEEEVAYYEQLEEEQSLLKEGLNLFKGKRAWISLWVGLVMVLLMAAGIYCIVEFFNTNDVKELIAWGGGFLFAMMSISILKVYAWMQMDKNALMREIKRLEFQVSVLVKEVSRD